MGTALVTGASAGLGEEFCRQLAQGGHDLVLVARDRSRLQALADELARGHGVRTEVLVADLADRAQVERVAERLADHGRPVDLLVNNAGFGARRSILRSEVTDEERALDVMVRAVLVLSHAAARGMRGRGHGAILNVSSVAGFAAMGSYSAIKSWVTVFSEGLAHELRGSGVTVTAVCPGFTRTQFHSRAEMDMSALPDALWLQAPDVVRASLAGVAAGRAVVVPGVTYRALTAVMSVLPREVVRRVSARIGARRRTAE